MANRPAAAAESRAASRFEAPGWAGWRTGAVVGLLVWSLPTLAQAQAVDRESWGWGHMMGGSWGWGGMMGGGIGMVLFWVVLVVLAVYLVRTFTGRSCPGWRGGNRSSLDILEERFARGEIDEREFQDRRRVLLDRDPRRDASA